MSMAEVIESIEKDMWRVWRAEAYREASRKWLIARLWEKSQIHNIFAEEYLANIHQRYRV